MKYVLTIFLSFLAFGILISQNNWKVKSEIIEHDYYLLEGKINNKYPIEMYLTNSWESCGTSKHERWNASGLKGWYWYSKIKKKIPLFGSMQYDNPNYYVKLYVPQNPLDSIDQKTCEIKDFKEIFIADECCQMRKMQWRLKDKNTFLPVTLEETHKFSYHTDAKLFLAIKGINMVEIDLSAKTKVEFIQDIDILSSKNVNNKFHVIFQFGHMTKPGSNGSGLCGAGYEEYLGYFRINNSLELEEFTYYQTESCIGDIPYDIYTYQKEHPELGIIKKD